VARAFDVSRVATWNTRLSSKRLGQTLFFFILALDAVNTQRKEKILFLPEVAALKLSILEERADSLSEVSSLIKVGWCCRWDGRMEGSLFLTQWVEGSLRLPFWRRTLWEAVRQELGHSHR
jgi:hypothetical protein